MGINFRDFRDFAQIRGNKFPQNFFSKHAESEWDYNEHDGNVLKKIHNKLIHVF